MIVSLHYAIVRFCKRLLGMFLRSAERVLIIPSVRNSVYQKHNTFIMCDGIMSFHGATRVGFI